MRTSHVLTAAALALSALAPSVHAQSEPTSSSDGRPLFTAADGLLLGSFVVGAWAARPFDRSVARRLRDSTTQAIRYSKEFAAGLNWLGTPGTLVIGAAMYSSGRWIFDNDDMADLGLHGTEAVAAGLLFTMVGKAVAGRQRPHAQPDKDEPHNFGFMRGLEDEQYRSFPSGHTTMSFAAAAAVTSESRRWWPNATWAVGPLLYGGATLVGVARIYSDKHWATDVIVGAAVGTFAGLKVVRYNHLNPDNAVNRWLLTVSGVPDGRGGLAWRVGALPLFGRAAEAFGGGRDGRRR